MHDYENSQSGEKTDFSPDTLPADSVQNVDSMVQLPDDLSSEVQDGWASAEHSVLPFQEDAAPDMEDSGESCGDLPSMSDSQDQPFDLSILDDPYLDADSQKPKEDEAPENDDISMSLDHEKLTTPELSDTISRDEDAYGFHGMSDPAAPEQPFDLSILNDPDLEKHLQESDVTTPSEGKNNDFREALFPEDEQEAPWHDPEEVQASPAPDRPVRKGRPRRKKGEGLLGIPNILVTAVWAAVVLAIGITLGRMLWICAAEVLAFGKESQSVTITVYETDTIEDITDKLYEAGLIRYPDLFKLYAKFTVDEGEIHPGIWDLNTMYDYHALVKMMSPSSSRSVVKVTIPEGFTCRQIFALLEENKVCTVNDITSAAMAGDFGDYWFLEGIETGSAYCLEGYLFPDTYEFYTNDKPKNVLNKMLDNFGSRVVQEDADLRDLLPALNAHLTEMMEEDEKSEGFIASHQLTMQDVIIVASLIEKETSGKDESPTIASVIYNRLYRWGDTPAYLNIDASIIYALDGKADLTAEDMRVDSPYNTYYNTGLTPGPIANPGLDSIRAALEPVSTDYYYYILDPAEGTHHFSETLEEHEAFRESLRNS